MSQDNTKLTILVPTRLHRKVKVYAASKGLSMAQVVITAIEALFQNANGGK